MSNSINVKVALNTAFDRLMSMPDDQFSKELSSSEDVSSIILHGGFLNPLEESYSDSFVLTNVQLSVRPMPQPAMRVTLSNQVNWLTSVDSILVHTSSGGTLGQAQFILEQIRSIFRKMISRKSVTINHEFKLRYTYWAMAIDDSPQATSDSTAIVRSGIHSISESNSFGLPTIERNKCRVA